MGKAIIHAFCRALIETQCCTAFHKYLKVQSAKWWIKNVLAVGLAKMATRPRSVYQADFLDDPAKASGAAEAFGKAPPSARAGRWWNGSCFHW